mgnify:CR=1 FL=1
MSRVAVVGGGASPEHEVSLASAAGVAGALRAAGHEVVELTVGGDGSWHGEGIAGLADAVAVLASCAAVFPALHGVHGEDGTLAALCDLVGVPCIGSPLAAGALAMDKWATKLVAAAVGVRTADGVLLTRGTPYSFSGTVVVKPVTAGSSHGVALVGAAAELGPALEAAFDLDDRVLVEEVIIGREIDVAVLGRPSGARVVAPALEVVRDGIFDTEAKYGGSADFRIPAVLDDAERKGLEDAAVAMYDALGCGGVARIDFFLTDDGPVLNEVNTMPGFTRESQVPKMFAAAGTSYAELLDLLVHDVLAP